MSTYPQYTIVSGPIIIEDGKILLVREDKHTGITPWMLPGGAYDPNDDSLESTCKRECKEETGLDIEIIKPLRTLILPRTDTPDEKIVLVHWLARRLNEPSLQAEDVVFDIGWHDIHDLPKNTAPNVVEIVKDL